MVVSLRRLLLLPLAGAVILGLASAQACEKHLRGHGSASSEAEPAAQR